MRLSKETPMLLSHILDWIDEVQRVWYKREAMEELFG